MQKLKIQMKIILQSCLYLILICFMSCNTNQDDYDDISESEQAVNNLLHKLALSLGQKNNMRACGTAVSMPRGVVKELGLDFQIRGPLSREEIRKILVQAVQEFLFAVNSDEVIRPYLEIYPFKIENIDMSLFLNDLKGEDLDDPYIGIAGIREGRLFYQNLITIKNIPSLKSEFEESYEEALKLLKVRRSINSGISCTSSFSC